MNGVKEEEVNSDEIHFHGRKKSHQQQTIYIKYIEWNYITQFHRTRSNCGIGSECCKLLRKEEKK